MPANKIVVHEKSGNILKGTTADFFPKRPLFHLAVGGIHGEEVKKIAVEQLKAIFFVRDFNGNRDNDFLIWDTLRIYSAASITFF